MTTVLTMRSVDSTDATAVVIRCIDSDTVVRLCDRRRLDHASVQYTVEACAPGLSARVDETVAAAWDPAPDLPAFLGGLAEDFRGWSGERQWHSLERDVTVTAVFRSGGHVGLTWTLRPWRARHGGSRTTVTTWQEAGEQMTALAADVRAFLREAPVVDG
jgi:Family of unknown function (DUF6228)